MVQVVCTISELGTDHVTKLLTKIILNLVLVDYQYVTIHPVFKSVCYNSSRCIFMQLSIVLVTHSRQWSLFPWLRDTWSDSHAFTHCTPQKPGQAYPAWQLTDKLTDTAAILAAVFDFTAAVFSVTLMLGNYLESSGPIIFSRKGQSELLKGR